MTKRRQQRKADDPFRNACSACGADVGKPCATVGNDNKPLVSRATRLVHAARLEGAPHA